MSEIRNIPVVSDGNRQYLIGFAEIKDKEITIKVKFEDMVKVAEQLVVTDQLRGFMLGFQYFLPKQGTESNMAEG